MRRFYFLAWLALLAFANDARAVLEPNGSDDSAYQALGTQFQGKLLSFNVLVPGVGTGIRQASAAYFNSQYAITAAHNVQDLLQYNPTYEIATGDNFLTNRGTVVPVSSVLIHPSYIPGYPKNTIDLAIIHLATPLLGTVATIDSVTIGDSITTAGFGRTGTPSTGLNPVRDGQSRGWVSPVRQFTASDITDAYYFQTFFGSSSGVQLNGRGASGDSGGPAYDEDGNLVGLTVAESPPFDSTVGLTYYLDLSQPDIHDWILANTVITELPGDFNHDSSVDAADYVVWRLSSDSADDYNLWRTHFGQSNYAVAATTRGAAIPEPTRPALDIFGVMISGMLRTRSRRPA